MSHRLVRPLVSRRRFGSCRIVALALPAIVGSAAGQPLAPLDGAAAEALPLVAGDPPNFAEHVAPIVFANCTSCHRPGEVGPFALQSYEDVRKRGKMIARVVERRLMPPWHPVEGHGEFSDELALSAAEVETLVAWVDAGCPEGDAKKTPPLPKFTEGWQLGEPDLVVKMAKGFDVPAGGPDIYRNFVIPLGFPEDRYLTAIEVRPSSRAALHHVLFFLDETGEARKNDGKEGKPGFRARLGGGDGQLLGADTAGLGGWAVGGMPRHLPLGLARRVPKGADLVLQSHLHPSGKPETEQTVLGLHFAKEPPQRTMATLQLPPLFGVSAGLDIPAGEAAFKLHDSFVLPVDAEAVMVGGHAHLLCTTMQVWVTRPQQERESVFFIDQWDFDWQNQYQYREPLPLQKGSKVEVELTYDNSAANKNNPHDPPQRVRWGEETTDEMGSISLLLVAKQESDAEALLGAIRLNRVASMARGARKAAGGGGLLEGLAARAKALDTNKDGTISADEIPAQMKPFVGRLDANGDGNIDPAELAALTGEAPGEAPSGARPAPAPAAKKPTADTPQKPGSGPKWSDVDGTAFWPLDPGEQKGHVLVFVTPDCPIANSYAPEIAALAKEFATEPLRFFVVHVDPDTDAAAAKAHAQEYSLRAPLLLDPKHVLAKKLGITKTPEVALITAGGAIAYRGRIDDQWGDLAKKRPQPTVRDLRDALAAVLAGKKVANDRTEAIGCDLPSLKKGPAGKEPSE
ncbi:MAG: redoxin domain-containing protein [Planctomycetes bacterium]|nr:redoxin domain-containing protein [Planctomycetota bacterium]